MSARASALGRSSGGATSAVLTVGENSFSSWVHRPTEIAAVARLRAGSLYEPVTLNEYDELVGHITARPCAGPSVALSSARSGLSNVTLGTLLLYQEPVYPTVNSPFGFANSSMLLTSV